MRPTLVGPGWDWMLWAAGGLSVSLGRRRTVATLCRGVRGIHRGSFFGRPMFHGLAAIVAVVSS